MHIRMTFLLTGGHEVHSSTIEVTEEEHESLVETLGDMVRDGSGQITLDPILNSTGQKVESILNVANVAAIRIVHAGE